MHFRTRSRQPGSSTALQLISNATKHQTFLMSLPDTRLKLTTNRNSVACGISRIEVRRQSTKRLRHSFFDSPSSGDLSNPIHPIFQPNNFVDPNIHYRPLENSLRLASRFLTTKQLLPFWYMLLCGPIETARTKPHSGPSEPLSELTEQQKNETTASLELLASCVTFTSERSWGRGDSGFTERLLLDAPSPFHGVKTSISISRRVFRMVERSFSKPYLGNEFRLWTHFLLVNLLLHELAHAAMYAAHPRPPAHDPIQAYFLPSARTTEEGMEWETSVFGGLLYEIPSFFFWERWNGVLGSKIVLREWPSHRLVASYRKSIYPRPFPVKGDVPTHDRLWLVPTTFFERLFTTAFWEETVPTLGAGALRPACTESFISRGPLGFLISDSEKC